MKLVDRLIYRTLNRPYFSLKEKYQKLSLIRPSKSFVNGKKHLFFMKATVSVEMRDFSRTFEPNICNCMICNMMHDLAGLIELS